MKVNFEANFLLVTQAEIIGEVAANDSFSDQSDFENMLTNSPSDRNKESQGSPLLPNFRPDPEIEALFQGSDSPTSEQLDDIDMNND